jgi:hypothetical protein
MGALPASGWQLSLVEGAGDDVYQRIGAAPLGSAGIGCVLAGGSGLGQCLDRGAQRGAGFSVESSFEGGAPVPITTEVQLALFHGVAFLAQRPVLVEVGAHTRGQHPQLSGVQFAGMVSQESLRVGAGLRGTSEGNACRVRWINRACSL